MRLDVQVASTGSSDATEATPLRKGRKRPQASGSPWMEDLAKVLKDNHLRKQSESTLARHFAEIIYHKLSKLPDDDIEAVGLAVIQHMSQICAKK